MSLLTARFAVSSSSSYKELDQDWKQALLWLHDDYFFRYVG